MVEFLDCGELIFGNVFSINKYSQIVIDKKILKTIKW